MPGPSGRLQELEEVLEVLFYKQKLTDMHIRKLQRKLRDEMRKNERLEIMLRQAMDGRDRTRKESEAPLRVNTRKEPEAPLRVKEQISESKVKALKEFFENIKE